MQYFYRIQDILTCFWKLKKKFRKNKPKITLYNVISSYNYEDFEKMVEFAFRVKADAVNFTPADIVPGLTDSLMLNKKKRDILIEDVKNIWDKTKGWERQYDHNIEFKDYELFLRRLEVKNIKKGHYDKTIIGKIPCYAGFNFLRILANGDVNSCLKSGRIPVGNIYKDNIKYIWMNQKQKQFRKHTLNYDINDPFFKNIGNTTQKGNGCLYSCDNIGWNLLFHQKIKKISSKSHDKFK
jgi:MoaA/NifB/PqqE/SkfB family radical SAM enzyme